MWIIRNAAHIYIYIIMAIRICEDCEDVETIYICWFKWVHLLHWICVRTVCVCVGGRGVWLAPQLTNFH